MTIPAYIHGKGFYVPERILTNQELEAMVDTSDEWITTRTGIKERRIAAPGQATSDLAEAAARKALADARMEPSELTHILISTLTPDAYCPSTATKLQHILGCGPITAMDLNAACSGFMYGLYTARAILAAEPEARVLLVAAEVLSTRTNWTDRTTCVLFGDGAGAAVLTGKPAPGATELVDVTLGSDGTYWELLTVKGGGSGSPYTLGQTIEENFFIQMRGRETFKVATRTMIESSQSMLDKHGISNGDLGLLITHQANLRIIEYVGKKLGLDPEQIYVNINRFGNTSAASVGIALAEATELGVIKPGTNVLLTTFGGGFTWGSALLRTPGE